MSSPDTTSLVPALEGHRLGLLALVADFTVPLVLSVLAAWRSAIGCDDVQVLGHTAQRLTLVDAAPRNLSPNQVVVLASEALALLAVGANGTKRLLAGASLKVGHDGCRDVLRDVVVATKFASPKERNALADWFNGGPEKVKEWLEVWDAIVAAERTRGIGKMKDYASVRSKTRALHRVVIGYLRFPDKFPRPDTVGNPMTATKRSPERTGTIQDALENSEFYQPTR